MRAADRMKVFHQTLELALRTYPRELHRYLLRRWRDRDGVEDLMQEVHLRLVRNGSDLPMPDKPLAYLYTIASNVIQEKTEAEARRHLVEFDSEKVEDWASDPNHALSDDMAERLDLERTLEQGLQQLPPMQRDILVLHYHEGLTCKQIAERTGLSVNSIDKYISRGKARMRQLLWNA